jgi:hypothetical protein
MEIFRLHRKIRGDRHRSAHPARLQSHCSLENQQKHAEEIAVAFTVREGSQAEKQRRHRGSHAGNSEADMI